MAIFANCYRIGAQYELEGFAFRHLAVIEDMPTCARFAAGFATFQCGAQKIETGLIFKRTGVGCPLHIFFLVDIPMVALAADEPQLPSVWRPVGRIRARCRGIGIGQPNAGRRGGGAV